MKFPPKRITLVLSLAILLASSAGAYAFVIPALRPLLPSLPSLLPDRSIAQERLQAASPSAMLDSACVTQKLISRSA